jgi:RHS repeat-associated protein
VEQVPQFLHSDPVYSTVLLTSESGERMQEIEYLPFGEVLFDRSAADNSGLPQAYRFDGKELDPETGLQYVGARYYDPRLGRWISADPLYRTRPDMSVENPKNLNLFAFAQNNPVRIFDRDGRQSQEEESTEPFKEGGFHGPVERPGAHPFDIDRFMEKHEEETRKNWMGDTVYTRVLGEDGQPIEDKDKYFGGRVIEEKQTTYRIEDEYAVMRQEYVVKTYVRKKVRDPETGEVKTVVTMERQTRVTEMWIQFPEDPEQREISRRAWTAKKRGVSSFDPSAIADMANLPDAAFPPVSKFGETLDESQFFDAAEGLTQ